MQAKPFSCYFSKEVVLVYQMGKVGSTSIYDLARTELTVPVFQIHRFRMVRGTFVDRGVLRTWFRSAWAKCLLWAIKNKEIKILSVTRERVSRSVSDFFQTLDCYIYANKLDKENVSTSELVGIFYS